MGKQEVSLGESRSFVRGKSEFHLGKVQEAKRAEKREDLGLKIIMKLLYILSYSSAEACVLLQKLRSVKSKNNLELIEKILFCIDIFRNFASETKRQ